MLRPWDGSVLYYLFYQAAGSRNDPHNMYIKKSYPGIWTKLHPWGDFSHNGFAYIGFLLGRYDDGTDGNLNRIREKQKRGTKILLWVFFLVPAVWIINLIAIGVAWIATK